MGTADVTPADSVDALVTPEWLTASWLGDVLGCDVTTMIVHRIGDGLVGLNLRIAVDTSATNAPDSVVVKLPSIDETSRATGVALRNYEREVKFYRQVASTVDIRVPHCHHADLDDTSGDFVLVLEDMAPAEQGDQLAGCSPETAELAVRELARLHGPRWDDPDLDDIDWLSRRGEEELAAVEGLWAMFLPSFLDTYRLHLTGEQARLLDRFAERFGAWLRHRDGHLAVTHGDYRLDNLLFGTAAGGPAVTAVDWQTPGHGMPIADLSYFVGAGLAPDDRRRHERALIDVYVAQLAEYDATPDHDWVWHHYRRDAFGGAVMAVIASQVVGESERSEAMFAALASRHLQQALDLDALSLVDG